MNNLKFFREKKLTIICLRGPIFFSLYDRTGADFVFVQFFNPGHPLIYITVQFSKTNSKKYN